MNDKIQGIWDKSIPFKHPVKSYLYMITHPRKCLRMLNFAVHVIATYKIQMEGEK